MVGMVAASCSLGDPSDAGSINLYLEVDKATLALGDSMNVTVTARNVGFDPLTLTGPSDCLLFVQVLNPSGQVVWDSQVNCTGQTVTEEVVPGTDKIQSFWWDGTSSAGARLGAGFYHIRGVARVTGAAYIGPPLSVALE
jgi:hypothetical protein